MKNLFSSIRSWLFPKEERVSEVALLRMEYESRIQSLETTTRRLAVMLKHGEVDVTVSEQTLKEHFQTLIREIVEDAFDFETLVSDAINDYDFSDAVDTAIGDRDWDYELRHTLDWDKVAERVSEKLDWETIVSDNDIITRGDYDFDDMMLKSEHMSEDDIVTRDELSDMVVGETKRDWFTQMLKDEVARHFKDTLQRVRETEEANCRNAIDEEIEHKVSFLITEELQKKFGDSFDIWFHNLIAHSVKQVISDMIVAAHQQVVDNNNEESAS